jgi:hypothetical protein
MSDNALSGAICTSQERTDAMKQRHGERSDEQSPAMSEQNRVRMLMMPAERGTSVRTKDEQSEQERTESANRARRWL